MSCLTDPSSAPCMGSKTLTFSHLPWGRSNNISLFFSPLLYCIQSLLFTPLHLLLHFSRWPCHCKYLPPLAVSLTVDGYFSCLPLSMCSLRLSIFVFHPIHQYRTSSSFYLLSDSDWSECVCVCVRRELKVCLSKMWMSFIDVPHVYRNSMAHGLGLAWVMANRVQTDLSDITLHATPIDFHWLFFSAEWHQYHHLTPFIKRLCASGWAVTDDAGYFHAVGWNIDLWQERWIW